ncbi:helix-turn-helix domain-containing protein [Paenibacillus sp. GCM10023252]|uniref:AraC family transcriptional regulator n=1 Tax=Paenibacillus sp. GCM10023252 TaxID=3252649 RepID=UPI00361CA2BB
MTYPQTFDAEFFPILASNLPLIVSVNTIHHSFPSHRHDCMEFSLVIEGEGTEWVNGIPHPMMPGTFTFIMPYQFHEIRVTGDRPLRLLNCMFGTQMLTSLGADSTELMRTLLPRESSFDRHTMQLQEPLNQKTQELMQELYEEFNAQSPLRSTMLRAKLSELLVLIERSRMKETAASAGASGTETGKAVERTNSTRQGAATGMHRGDAMATKTQPVRHSHNLASTILHDLYLHYREELTLKTLSTAHGLSTVHISGLLKQLTGRTFVQLLHEIRLRQACSLLVTTDMKIADAAVEAGFQSTQTFFRVFKQEIGVTPAEYKARYQQSQL